jgi:hypothetical protein
MSVRSMWTILVSSESTVLMPELMLGRPESVDWRRKTKPGACDRDRVRFQLAGAKERRSPEARTHLPQHTASSPDYQKNVLKENLLLTGCWGTRQPLWGTALSTSVLGIASWQLAAGVASQRAFVYASLAQRRPRGSPPRPRGGIVVERGIDGQRQLPKRTNGRRRRSFSMLEELLCRPLEPAGVAPRRGLAMGSNCSGRFLL